MIPIAFAVLIAGLVVLTIVTARSIYKIYDLRECRMLIQARRRGLSEDELRWVFGDKQYERLMRLIEEAADR